MNNPVAVLALKHPAAFDRGFRTVRIGSQHRIEHLGALADTRLNAFPARRLRKTKLIILPLFYPWKETPA